MSEPARSEPPPPVGFVFPTRDVEVSRERQRRQLECCGVDPDIWGDCADPSLFAFFGIMAQRWTGRSINGNVHMTQSYRLSRGLPLDAPLAMSGEVTRIDPHPRGEIVHAAFTFQARDGSTPLVAGRSSLNPGSGEPSAPSRPRVEDPLDRMTQMHEVTLEPKNVASFSDEAENLIHSDPATAERFGFRAPIAGGLMASHIILGALVAEGRSGPATELDAEIEFLRPMFWDERLRLFTTEPGGTWPGPRRLVLLGDDDKPRCRASVERIVFG